MDSGLTKYRSALDKLFARTGSTARFGLDRTKSLLSLLGNPHERVRSFHVAGTNGKGSVVAMLDTLLRAKGISVGRYTSPHLVDFRERIVVNGEEIGEQEILDFIARWETDFERLGATFFEITTALALEHFASRKVDVAVIETGLGGRLDSTNVITPLVAGVTSIGMDHVEYLGDSLASIAAEKAGIFKRGVPAVFGPVREAAREALLTIAARAGAEPIFESTELYRPENIRVDWSGTTFEVEHHGEVGTLTTALVGEPQAINTCTALAMLDAAGDPYRTTLAAAADLLPSVTLPGRFQRARGGKVILDVAHNPDGIRALASSLATVAPPRPIVAVIGILRDKDWRQMMRALCPVVDATIVTRPASAPPTRVWDPAEALKYGIENGWRVSLSEDVRQAMEQAAGKAATVVVTGSFHTVGDATLFGGLA
ncbi:MAG TPA: folylpolyglutamate synthase/dihydrofolate synthase family protein [Rhodothermia bacterium]|nr:folylpolyglutamate synthase/dihydrofolate synthase family protein [Rhodothermia bacterium]